MRDPEQHETSNRTPRAAAEAKIPRRAWAVFALIYLVTIPWYLPRDWIDPTVWAFPAWATVMVSGAIALAAFNAYAFLRLWPKNESDGSDDQDSDSRADRRGDDKSIDSDDHDGRYDERHDEISR